MSSCPPRAARLISKRTTPPRLTSSLASAPSAASLWHAARPADGDDDRPCPHSSLLRSDGWAHLLPCEVLPGARGSSFNDFRPASPSQEPVSLANWQKQPETAHFSVLALLMGRSCPLRRCHRPAGGPAPDEGAQDPQEGLGRVPLQGQGRQPHVAGRQGRPLRQLVKRAEALRAGGSRGPPKRRPRGVSPPSSAEGGRTRRAGGPAASRGGEPLGVVLLARCGVCLASANARFGAGPLAGAAADGGRNSCSRRGLPEARRSDTTAGVPGKPQHDGKGGGAALRHRTAPLPGLVRWLAPRLPAAVCSCCGEGVQQATRAWRLLGWAAGRWVPGRAARLPARPEHEPADDETGVCGLLLLAAGTV